MIAQAEDVSNEKYTANEGKNIILASAEEMRAVGLHTVPPRQDGSKEPLGTWKKFQKEQLTDAEFFAFFRAVKRTGLGFVTGTSKTIVVNGEEITVYNEVLDFDHYETFLAYEQSAEATGLKELLDRVKAGWMEETPKPGVHLHYWTPVAQGNIVLAKTAEKKVLIETRGVSGYIVTAPSFGKVHPSGKPYVRISGGPRTMAVLTAEERQELFRLARSFNEDLKKEERYEEPRGAWENAGDRPGDLFAARATWQEILAAHGWTPVFERNGVTHWRRPGKDRGTSATTNYAGTGLFYVFTTSTTFEANRGYNKFATYTFLNHAGDFGDAALALADRGYTLNGNGFHSDEDENAWWEEQERETEAEAGGETTAEPEDATVKPETGEEYPCPDHLWRGMFGEVANAVGRKTWDIWLAVLVALGARAWRNIDLKYHRRLYGMVYGLLIKGTGMGKGLSTDVCRALMPDWYVIRDAVQSGPALAPILATIERDKKNKVISCESHPALLLIEEFTVLLKNAGIQHSTLFDTINNLFHRTWPWNVSRSERPGSGGGDVVIKDPSLSILATTTQSLFKEYVSPQMIRSGFLNRFFVLPGDATPWKFYDPDGAGRIIDTKVGLLDDMPVHKWGEGKTVWQMYEPAALKKVVEWGSATFEPIMQSSELDAESVKRLHVYCQVISFLYAYSERRESVPVEIVECTIPAIETSLKFLLSLIAQDRDPEIPKFKAYEISLEQKILARVKAEKGIRRRTVIRALAGRTATSADISALVGKLLNIGVLTEVVEGKAHKLYLPEDNPQRKRK